MENTQEIPEIGCFATVRQIMCLPSPRIATKYQGKIVAVGIYRENASPPVLFTPWGEYPLPSVCHILVADGRLYAAGRFTPYTFVYPPGEIKRVFGARGVYERGSSVWYCPSPGCSPVSLFPSPLLFLATDGQKIIAANHYHYAVLNDTDIVVGQTETVITKVGITGGRWYIIRNQPRKMGTIITMEGVEEVHIPYLAKLVVGNVIIAQDYRQTAVIFPDGKKVIAPLVRCFPGDDDSLLVVGRNAVVELAMAQ